MSHPTRFALSRTAVHFVAAVLLVAGFGVTVYGVIALRSLMPPPQPPKPVSAFVPPARGGPFPELDAVTTIDCLVVGGIMTAAVGAVLLAGGRRADGAVKVRCRDCRGLNDETAKFCSGGGHAV